MSDVNTLDQKIRSRAKSELQVALSNAMHAVMSLAQGQCGMIHVKVRNIDNTDGCEVYAGSALRSIQEAIVEYLEKPIGDKAVADFIQKVDNLADEVDSLREEVHQ